MTKIKHLARTMLATAAIALAGSALAHHAWLRMLKEISGAQPHVPYRGNAPALQGLLASDVSFMFPTSARPEVVAQENNISSLE